MHIKKTNGELQYSKQYLNFNRTNFLYSTLFGDTWPSNIGWATFGKRILSLAVRGLFYLCLKTLAVL